MKRRNLYFLAFLGSMLAMSGCLEENVNESLGKPSPIITIEDVRSMYRGADVQLTTQQLSGAHQIVGVVISDASSQNTPNGTLVIQNKRKGRTRGILLELGMGTPVPFVPGDSVVVDIAGSTLSSQQGATILKGVSLDQIQKVGEGKAVVPMAVTAAQLYANPDAYEGTLVQLAANVSPVPVSGTTYAGNFKLVDNGADTVQLHTQASASFASRRVPASASFTGIAFRTTANNSNLAKPLIQLWMRNASDVTNGSGPIYAGWPEDFEAFTSKGYAAANMQLTTGNWRFDQALVAIEANDRAKSGAAAVRFQQKLSVPAMMQMNFDVPNGASKITAWVGVYGASADLPSEWKLEYSQDGGVTWTQLGENVWSTSKTKQLHTFLMDISGPVRFRVNKLGNGNSDTDSRIQNGRLSLDDFAIYEGTN